VSAVRVAAVDDPALDWGDPAVGAYARALAALGPDGALENARFHLAALQLRDRALTLVVPQGRQACWLTAPSVTYGQTLREEVERELKGGEALAAKAASWLAEGLLRVTQADDAVYVNHLLFSTSLHGGWDGVELDEALTALRMAYPDRTIVWRSLNAVDHAGLLARMQAAGGRRLLSRLIWRLPDPERQWTPRRDVRRDLALTAAGGFTVETDARPTPEEIERLLALYTGVYIAKYSRANPRYTAAALAAGITSGVLRLSLVRGPSGEIVAFAADQTCGGELATPMLGHDRTRPEAEGLFRIAMALSIQHAVEQGLAVNGSAGAAAFKRHRGATPALEHQMVFDDHLPPWRRAGYALLAKALDALTPTLERIAAG